MSIVRQSSWKKIGTDITTAPSWKEALEVADLDWTVSKQTLKGPAGQAVPAWGIFRDDTNQWLGAAGKDFTPVQNEKSFAWMDAIVNTNGGAKYVRAGALDGGASIFCLAQLPETIRIKRTDDVTTPYLLFTNSHQVGYSAVGKILQDRKVCSNGLIVTVTVAELTSYAHRVNIAAQMDKGRDALIKVRSQIKDVESLMNILAATKVSPEVVADVIRSSFPKIEESTQQQNKARDILELFEDNDAGAFPSEAGSAYALLNAYTNHTDHVSSARAGKDSEEVMRAKGAMFGAGEAFKFAALTALVHSLGRHSLASFSEKETASVGIW